MNGTIENDFPSWLDRHLAERDWEVSDLARRAGISASIIFRWRKSYRPNITNARAVARAFGVPLLEVLIAAGQITSEEAHANVSLPPSISDLDTVELTRELHRRAEARDQEQWSTTPVEYLAELMSRAPRGPAGRVNRKELWKFQRDLQRQLEAQSDPPSSLTDDDLPPEPEGLSEPNLTPGANLVFDAGHGRQVTLRLVHVDSGDSAPDHDPPDQDRSNTNNHST